MEANPSHNPSPSCEWPIAVTKRQTRAAVLGAVISLCFIGLLLKRVDLHQTWTTLRGMDPRFLLVPLLMLGLNYPLRAWRWRLMFPRRTRPGYSHTFRTFAIGNGANNFVPGRGGDVARCMLIAGDSSLSGSTLALGTLAVEKVLDGLALLAIVLLACVFISPPGWLIKLLVAGAAIFGIALVVMAALRYRAAWFVGLVAAACARLRLTRLAGRLPDLFAAFAEGLHAISSFTLLLWLFTITAMIWLTEAGLVWGIAKPLGVSLSLPDAVVVAAVLGLGLMIPAGPAAIGTYEFFVVAAMGLAGVASGTALAYAVLLHSWVLVSSSLIGFTCLTWAGMSVQGLLARDAPSLEKSL